MWLKYLIKVHLKVNVFQQYSLYIQFWRKAELYTLKLVSVPHAKPICGISPNIQDMFTTKGCRANYVFGGVSCNDNAFNVDPQASVPACSRWLFFSFLCVTTVLSHKCG